VPLHDYVCPVCAVVLRDIYRPVAQRASENPPLCLNGHVPTKMDWCPAVGAIDLQVRPFPVHIKQPDGSYREVEVTSIQQMRQIERETAQAAKNGEGEALSFRMWSQDHSNGDVNVFGDPRAAVGDTPVALSAETKRKFGRRGAFKAVDHSDGALGPGVTEDTASPLLSGE